MATELQQSLLDSIQMLSQNSVDNSNSPATIKATIVDVIDSATYRYLIKYGDNSRIEAISSSSASYQVGDTVYVLVPDGDLSKTNIILGAAVPYAALYAALEEASNTYIEITDSLFGEVSGVNLKSWENHSPTEAGSQIAIDTTNFGLVFKDYLENYKKFIFTAKVKTEIDKYHQVQGNYGLVLKLPFYVAAADGSKTQTWKICQMDVDSMLGNPYDYRQEQLINLYYDIPEGWTYDTTRDPELASFVEGFGYAAPRADIEYDIHFNNIGIKIADTLTDADKTGYYLSLVASSGNYFLAGKYEDTKTLTPKLKVNGKDTSISSWNCYWFIEDASIKTNSDGYLSLGGLGWKCINEKTNIGTDDAGKTVYQYITSNYTCNVPIEDVSSNLRYRCILTKDEIVVSGIILIKNLNSKIEMDLRTPTGSNAFVENIGNANIIARIYYPTVTDQDSDVTISYSWQRFDKDGDYIDDDFYTLVRYNDKVQQASASGLSRGVFETEITYPCYLLDQSNLIKCTFYSSIVKNGVVVRNILSTQSILVTTESRYDYKLSLYNGDVIYKYDADGDSPLIADYDGPTSSRIKTINPIEYKVFKADGSELNETEYRACSYTWRIPKNSMIYMPGIEPTKEDDNYYYLSGTGHSSLNYDILNIYNKSRNENNIDLTVDFAGSTLSSVASIKFLKDGESGTNGTKYSAIITYRERVTENDYAYGEKDINNKVRKLQFIYVENEAKWYRYDVTNEAYAEIGSPQLKLSLYADGAPVGSDIEYSYTWEMFDAVAADKNTSNETCLSIDSNGILRPSRPWTADTYGKIPTYTNIVRTTVTITDKNDTSTLTRRTIVYAYYPIEITWMKTKSVGTVTQTVPTMIGGFDQVLYNAGGTNPDYDSSTKFQCVDNLAESATDYYQYSWEVSDNLKERLPGTRTFDNGIYPASKYNGYNSKNYVRVVIGMSDEKMQELEEAKQEAQNNIQLSNDYLNFYNHNKERILAFADVFSYDDYVNRFSVVKTFLQYRAEGLGYTDSLREIIEQLKSCCEEYSILPSDFDYIYYYNDRLVAANLAKKNLYKLLKSVSTSSLKDLSNFIFDSTIMNQLNIVRIKYGGAAASHIQMILQTWNGQINAYQKVYKTLKNYNYEVVRTLHEISTDLLKLATNTNLAYLTRRHDNIEPLQEFINLKTHIETLTAPLNADDGSYTNYYNIDSLLLQGINTELSIYKNTEYQDKYYKEIQITWEDKKKGYEDQVEAYTKAMMPSNTSGIVHIKPIVMLLNSYELSYLNGWDGNKLYVDENNSQFIMAPQLGAGTKDSSNRFTGITMGLRNFSSGTQDVGLFGYSNGVQSIFLNAQDGSATFGKSGGGQIIMQPGSNTAIIKSGNYIDGTSGMMINLTTPEIKFGNGNFSVNSSGDLTAKGGGTIAGWNIGNKTLSAAGITINSEGTISGDGVGGDIWSINRGHATFSNATITGHIKARTGYIGTDAAGFEIDDNNIHKGKETLTDANSGVYIGADGIALGPSSKFKVDSAGNLVCSNASIDGTINRVNTVDGVRIEGNVMEFSQGVCAIRNNYQWAGYGKDTTIAQTDVEVQQDGSYTYRTQLLEGLIDYDWEQLSMNMWQPILKITPPPGPNTGGLEFNNANLIYFDDNNGRGQPVHGIDDSHTFGIEIDNGLPYLWVDGDRLGQIVIQ